MRTEARPLRGDSGWRELPRDLQRRILSHLSLIDVIKITPVDKHVRKLANELMAPAANPFNAQVKKISYRMQKYEGSILLALPISVWRREEFLENILTSQWYLPERRTKVECRLEAISKGELRWGFYDEYTSTLRTRATKILDIFHKSRISTSDEIDLRVIRLAGLFSHSLIGDIRAVAPSVKKILLDTDSISRPDVNRVMDLEGETLKLRPWDPIPIHPEFHRPSQEIA